MVGSAASVQVHRAGKLREANLGTNRRENYTRYLPRQVSFYIQSAPRAGRDSISVRGPMRLQIDRLSQSEPFGCAQKRRSMPTAAAGGCNAALVEQIAGRAKRSAVLQCKFDAVADLFELGE